MEESIGSAKLLDDVLTTGYGKAIKLKEIQRTYQVLGSTSSGAGAATVLVQVSNAARPDIETDDDWMTLGTVTLTLGVTQVSDGFASNAAWLWTRCKVTALSGTGAALNAWVSE